MCALYIARPKAVSIRSTVMQSWHQRLRHCFVDLRFMTGIMCAWLCAIIIVLMELEVFTRSKFMSFGPRPDLKFMHVSIDTYYKYNILIAMIIIHTFITDVISDSLVPHVLNVVQDTKNKYIPHKAFTYFFITTAWSVYCAFTQLFGIFIAFAQLDLLLFRLASDLLANAITLTFYLDGKIYDPAMYTRNNEHNKHHHHGNNNHNHNHNEEEEESDKHKLIQQNNCIEMMEVIHDENENKNTFNIKKNRKDNNNNNNNSTTSYLENQNKEVIIKDEEDIEEIQMDMMMAKTNSNMMNTLKNAIIMTNQPPTHHMLCDGEEKESLLLEIETVEQKKGNHHRQEEITRK